MPEKPTREKLEQRIRELKNAESENRHAFEALRESEAKFRYLTENISDIVWTVDMDFNTTYVSPSIENVLGFTPDERKNQSPEEMVTPESLKLIKKRLKKEFIKEKLNLAGQIRSIITETEYYRKDGSTLWMENHVSWMRNEKGKIIGIHGVSRDITDRMQAEIEKEKLQAQLNQAQKMESVGRLAGGVAHDFNNMLSVILGHAEMIQDQLPPDSSIQSGLEEIQKAARRSTDIVSQLLAFARKQTILTKVLDLNKTVESTLMMLRRLIGEDINLSWRPGKVLWPVRVDPSQIDQILANLCVNARDAISGVGKITIETENVYLDQAYCEDHAGSIPGEYVILSVCDDGQGMDEKTKENIFEPFFTTKEVGKGTGLGLSTAYGIVKQNNGFIYAESEPSQGTCLNVYLPRYSRKLPLPSREVITEQTAGGSETILLVEDEPAILEMTKVMLECQGYSVISAATPGEAIRLASDYEGNINLLMTDVVMPEMNGRDLARNLLLIHPDLKQLFMSGYTANVIAHHGVLDEGVHFIQKPFTSKELAASLREALDRE